MRKRVLIVGAISSLLLVACQKEAKTLVVPKEIHVEREQILPLKVAGLNELTLRASTSEDDPIKTIHSVSFLFFSGDEGSEVLSHIKTENISESNQLERINLRLPKGNYKLIALANLPEGIRAVGATDGTSKVGFYFGVLILVFLSIYLFVFYGSASFPAFFKVFTPDDNAIHQTMFDPRAFSLAWRDGVAELLFILLIPFIFLGLGFLIHKFQEGKSIAGYFKSALLILVTFAFDALLAFDITKKIYEVRSLNSFQEMPEYNKWMAIGGC